MYLKLKNFWLPVLLFSLAASPLAAVNATAGTTGFAALKVVYSARALALGQALTGQAENPDGLHYNPASIIRIDGNEISSTYANSFLGAQGGQLQYLWPKNRFTAWGFALRYMNYGSFDRTEMNQQGDLVEDLGTFGASTIIASASVAKYVSDAVDLGATLKTVWDKIDDSSATAILVDLGGIHHPANSHVKVGGSIRNLGLQTSYYTSGRYKEKLPLTFAAGITYRLNSQLWGTAEVSKASAENAIVKLGMEYELNPALQLRGGLRSNAAEGYNGGTFSFLSGFSLGAGWKWRNYVIDYGVSSYGDLGLVNQLSLKYEF